MNEEILCYFSFIQNFFVEETIGANFIVTAKDGEVITTKSKSILLSITRKNLLYVAEHYLGLKVNERPIKLSELSDFAECALCGTAAVLSPVGKVVDHGWEIKRLVRSNQNY